MPHPEPIRRLAHTYLPDPLLTRLRTVRRGLRGRPATTTAARGDRAPSADRLAASYRRDPDQALAAARELVSNASGVHALYEAARIAFVCGDLELARLAHALLMRQVEQHPAESPATTREAEWLLPWLARPSNTVEAPAIPAGHVSVAVLDYRQPSRAKTSQNIGDHIQTLAALGQLARFTDARFHGPPELADFAAGLRRRVPADRRVSGVQGDVSLTVASRDATNYELFPTGTWLIAYGWYMHPLLGLRHDFPLHPNLRPVFVSFHCNKPAMLTAAGVEYLRRYAPIGCRDWNTVDLLLARGVPAFFSGCLTTTVDTVLPGPRPHATDGPIYVDVPPGEVPAHAATARHSYAAVKRQSFVANLGDAIGLLERYRRHSYVVTQRLHCYLPARSLGLPVEFRTKNPADVRFGGLIDVDDTAFDGIRRGMLDRLECVLTAIVAGRGEDDVYQLWRETNAPAVAAARARLGRPTGVTTPPSR